MKDEKLLDDEKLEAVTGGGEYLKFVDSDYYQEIETYETAYKSKIIGSFADREISPLN